MEFIDEQNNLPFRLLHLIEHSLQPLLKFAPVLGASHQGAHIQGKDGLVLQTRGYVPFDNPLGQPFGDGGFAHAWLADEHGVILALSGQNANDIPDLVIPSDHRVQLVGPSLFHQVGAVFFQGLVGFLRVVGGHPLVPPQGGQGLHHPVLVHVVGLEQGLQAALGGVDQGQQDVLHRHILVLHAGGDGHGGVQRLVHPTGDIHLVRLPAGTGHLGQLLHLVTGSGLE